MKTNIHTIFGIATVSAFILSGTSSCVHRGSGVITPINLNKVATANQKSSGSFVPVTAPLDLEGAWIKLILHDKERSWVDWYYVTEGKAYAYTEIGNNFVNGHPVKPEFLVMKPDFHGYPFFTDEKGRSGILANLSYRPEGSKALLMIEVQNRHQYTVCRTFKNYEPVPAVIKFTSMEPNVYHGTIDAIYDSSDMIEFNASGIQVSSITIYTK